MMLRYLIQIVVTAVSYYFFSKEFFLFSSQLGEKKMTFLQHFVAFLIVFIWFVIASMMELPLIINWLVFMSLLVLEVYILLHFDFLSTCALTMFSIIMGLAVNIFFRSLMAILFSVPLNVFDNALSSVKSFPILLGFICMGVLFYLLRHFKYYLKLSLMFQNKKSLSFYSWIEGVIYIFLIIQLLAYSQTQNLIGIKIWGIKSSVFSMIALVLANIYALRVSSLNHYMAKQHEIHNQLIHEKEDINKLWELAYTDMLTGCSNRQLLDKQLMEYAEYGSDITVAFIDINGLKIINDQYGHLEGDRYLGIVSKALMSICKDKGMDLFRYGGDEFVLMSSALSKQTMEELLNEVNRKLQKDDETLYQKSISYGVVQGCSADYENILEMADNQMYQYKLKYYQNISRT